MSTSKRAEPEYPLPSPKQRKTSISYGVMHCHSWELVAIKIQSGPHSENWLTVGWTPLIDKKALYKDLEKGTAPFQGCSSTMIGHAWEGFWRVPPIVLVGSKPDAP